MYREAHERIIAITQESAEYSHEELARRACASGVRWVQLRMKNCDYTHWVRTAQAVKRICDEYSARLTVNDNVLVAREVGAHGVHLGPQDMDVADARRILGPHVIIGASVNSTEDLARLRGKPLDYLGIGPFRETQTKKDHRPVLGEEGLRSLVRSIRAEYSAMPLYVIGGICPEDVPVIFQNPVQGLALASSLNFAKDVRARVQEFIEAMTVYERATEVEQEMEQI
jgi:thiamine-phosphate pyrophosphorylase